MSSSADSDRQADRAALHAPFRPRRGRLVAWWVAGAEALVLAAVALAYPGGPGGFRLVDRVGVLAVAAAVGWVISRFALVSARPTEGGLEVRNLVGPRRLDWAQIVSVRFGGGDPWAFLELADTDTLAVLAIQRADGSYGAAEARRLATLVALHSSAEPADGRT